MQSRYVQMIKPRWQKRRRCCVSSSVWCWAQAGPHSYGPEREHIRNAHRTIATTAATIRATAATKSETASQHIGGSMLHTPVWLSQSFVTRSTCAIASRLFLGATKLRVSQKFSLLQTNKKSNRQQTLGWKAVCFRSLKQFPSCMFSCRSFFSRFWWWHYQMQTVYFS